MSIEEYRALIEPYLDSKGYDKGKSTYGTVKSYIKKLLDFMQEKNYSEISEKVISEYIESKAGTDGLISRQKRCEEFAEFVVKGEREVSMRDEKALEHESEATTDMSLSQESEPPTAENEAVQNDSDMAMNQETETPEPVQSEANIENEPERMNESVQNEPVQAETPKALGRPRKAAGDKRANSFSVYLNAENASALKDLAAYERKEVSVFLAEIIEKFISRNEQALMDYRMFQKNKKPLQ